MSKMSDNYPAGIDDCMAFGMVFGCRKDCPQLMREECEIYASVEDFLEGKEKVAK